MFIEERISDIGEDYKTIAILMLLLRCDQAE